MFRDNANDLINFILSRNTDDAWMVFPVPERSVEVSLLLNSKCWKYTCQRYSVELAMFIRLRNMIIVVMDELLIHGTTTGEDIFSEVEKYL
jgi:hypothetical protein